MDITLIGKMAEQLLGAMVAAEPVAPISWLIARDDPGRPLHLCFYVLGPANVMNLEAFFKKTMPDAEATLSTELTIRAGLLADELYGIMEARDDTKVWATMRDDMNRPVYMAGFVKIQDSAFGKVNQALTLLRDEKKLQPVPPDLGLPSATAPELPPT